MIYDTYCISYVIYHMSYEEICHKSNLFVTFYVVFKIVLNFCHGLCRYSTVFREFIFYIPF